MLLSIHYRQEIAVRYHTHAFKELFVTGMFPLQAA